MERRTLPVGFAGTKLTTGRKHLKHRSTITRQLKRRLPLRQVLLIEDKESDVEVISAVLRLILGHDTPIAVAKKAPQAQRHFKSAKPDVVILDDRLGHAISAEVSLATLREYDKSCRPIIVSGFLTSQRQTELAKLDVADVIHKDDIDAVRLMEALLRALGDDPKPQEILS